MKNIKDLFDNLSIQPDQHVWADIQRTLVVRRRRRIALSAAVAVTLLVASVFLVRGIGTSPSAPQLVAINDSPASSEFEILNSDFTPTIASSESDIQNSDFTAPATAVQDNSKSDIQYSNSTAEATALQKNSNSEIQNSDFKIQAIAPSKSEIHNSNSTTEATAVQKNSNSDIQNSNFTASASASASSESEIQNSNSTAEADNPVEDKILDPKLETTETTLWIPNAFSPDDPNDDNVRRFKVIANSTADIKSYKIYIYSRAGRLVFHSTDINSSWDGTANGHAQPMGTYVYIIETLNANSKLQHYKGTITLIR